MTKGQSMTTAHAQSAGPRLPILQGVLPIKASQMPAEAVAGLTLVALAIPDVTGYTKIAGAPVVTGLYPMLIPAVLSVVVFPIGLDLIALDGAQRIYRFTHRVHYANAEPFCQEARFPKATSSKVWNRANSSAFVRARPESC
ncbi:SulP family inorganic anion transporter [Thiohalocapsa sp.]|uniref:SulP family inorganic anion transporter n=1 Tax=Thiohalocapsa sp. TaxID=2497641 RepID=UPI0025E7CE68|nr:SulP family inorganic anion transporter [Thiohalocapsa sp.]